jgi:hypothetical protein
LSLLDVLTPRSLLCHGRLGTLGDVTTRLGFESIAADMDRSGAQLFDQVFRLSGITHKLSTFDVSILFADQPLDRRPGAAGTFPGNTLKMTFIADILRAEGFEGVPFANLNMIVIPSPSAARLLTTAPLGFLDILPGRLTLSFSSHTTSFKLSNRTNT